MGRYDGEDYAEQVSCRPGQHNWALNGTCWKCNRDRDALIRDAERLLEIERGVRKP